MSTPHNADDLFLLVRKSGLVEEAKLTSFQKAHQRDGLLQQDPRHIVLAMVREGLITNFQGEQFLLGKWRGFTLGKYKLLERVGVGGMGQVFLCEHTFMRRRLAVKVLPPSKAEDPVSLGRFYREARVASRLEHPNIVRTYDIDQDGPLHFLVMEYVDGTSLLEIVKKFGPMDIRRACHYIRDALLGLQYAHTQGMIHRDIKPGNIMVDRHGTAKLLDMGLARFYRDEKDQLTLKYDDKNVLGTADYVAPEQTRDSRNIDIRADIYGMGATFYYILTGQPPFPEATVAEKLIAHQTKKPRPIRELRPDIPPGIAKIIERMMAKDPKDRFQTPQEAADALRSWTEQPIDPPPEAELPKLSPAAMDPNYSPPTPVMPAPPVRDAGSVRPNEAPKKILELPQEDFEAAHTIPVPPPAPKPASMPAAATASGSVVDLIGIPLHAPKATPSSPAMKPVVPPAPTPSPAVQETRALAPDPTPQPRSKSAPSLHFGFDPPPRAPVLPKLRPSSADLETSGHTIPLPPSTIPGGKVQLPPLRPSAQGTPKPLSSSALGATKPLPTTPLVPPTPPAPPAAPMSRASIELPKLRSFHGIALPGADVPAPPPAPSAPAPAPRPPSISDMPRPPSIADMPRPPSIADMPRPPSIPDLPRPPSVADLPRSPSVESFRVSLPEPVRAPAPSAAPLYVPLSPPVPPPPSKSELLTTTPTYKPPTMMPFFDQPIVPAQPSLGVRLLRWAVMILISGILGAAIGVGLWYQFLRRVE